MEGGPHGAVTNCVFVMTCGAQARRGGPPGSSLSRTEGQSGLTRLVSVLQNKWMYCVSFSMAKNKFC